MTDGIVLIDKPAGITSFGVVARVRRILTQQAGHKVKVGHTGTLDPFATGLMILVVGPECKNAAHYSKLDKTYEAAFVLGKTSTTGDTEGEITQTNTEQPPKAMIEDALKHFTGVITQTPPVYSAIKINGRRAYDLARKGIEVDMPVRTVTITSLSLIDYTYPIVMVRAEVSSGTYIRSLVSDIGEYVGCGAYTTALRRTQIDRYSISEASHEFIL